MSTAENNAPVKPANRDWNRGQRVPVWLVVVVVLLMVAVVGVGAFAVVTMVNRPNASVDPTSPLAEWEDKASADPDNMDVQLGLAFAYQEEGRFDDAVRTYNVVLEEQPKNLGALYNKGVSLVQLDREPEAEASLKAVLAISPQHALAAKALGEYYRASERYSDMVTAVGPASEANPEMADLHALLGIAYENTGREKQAIAEYKEALRSTPDLETAKEGLSRLGGEAK